MGSRKWPNGRVAASALEDGSRYYIRRPPASNSNKCSLLASSATAAHCEGWCQPSFGRAGSIMGVNSVALPAQTTAQR